MKRRVISIITAVMLVFTCAFVVPATTHHDDAFAKSKSKYVKIKRTKYNNMVKTINNQKTTITNLNSYITNYKTTIANQKKTISNQSTSIQNQSKLIDDLNAQLKDKKQQVSWLWSTLEEFGYRYNYDTHKWEVTEEEEVQSDPEPLPWQELMFTEEVNEMMAEQTGLTIDNVNIIDSYRNWACYYVEADGDLYVITMKKGIVDVCQILN